MRPPYDMNLLFLAPFLLFGLVHSTIDTNLIRQDMVNLNVTCSGQDSCRVIRTSDSLKEYNCHCGPYCRYLGTCCFDSPFRTRPRQELHFVHQCLPVYGQDELHVYMVATCRKGWSGADDIRDMCSSTGEDRDDPFLAVPVTSLRSGLTYKNYYCAVCNENPRKEEVAFWNVEVHAESQLDTTDRKVHFYPDLKSWIIQVDDKTWMPVELKMQISDSARRNVKICRPDGYVSSCPSGWSGTSTAEKCAAYTALVYVSDKETFVKTRYKNPHCAICNSEQADALYCNDVFWKVFVTYAATRQTFFVGMFVLADEKKVAVCDEDRVWDELAKKCRRIRCRRNYRLINRECVPPNSP